MDRIVDLTLIAETYTTDAIHQAIATETTRTVPAVLSSIMRSEFVQAAQLGIRPSCMAKLALAEDYQGEVKAQIGTTRYTVYRTFETSDGGIELYLERRVGS